MSSPMHSGQAANRPFLGERFGNYLLMSKIANGGMAAIYLARPAKTAANGRVLVVKRILPQVANDPDFLEMFKSEIRICMGFSHPNIVQIYDFGQVRGQPYIAMELVEGKNLREVLNQFSRNGQMLPVGVAVSIAAQTAAGLHYAHTFRNRVTGEPLKVIHRDISPQNIILSYDGNVKLIDFGIAKAVVDDVEQTRTGSIKGKVCYLSPEQVRCEALEGTSDIFSLGAVLWELLTGQKLFTLHGRDDHEVMNMIKNAGKVVRPPSAINPKVPKQLDEIVLKALHPDKALRYQNALEFQKALRDFIVYSLPGFGYSDVAQCMRETFHEEMDAENVAIRGLNEQGQKFLTESQGQEVTEVSESIPSALPSRPASLVGGTGLTPPPFLHNALHQLTGSTPSMVMQGSTSTGLTHVTPPPFVANLDFSGTNSSIMAPRKSRLQVTRQRLLLAVLYFMTIWFIKVDEKYFLLERFFIPTEVVRYASMDAPDGAMAPAQIAALAQIRAAKTNNGSGVTEANAGEHVPSPQTRMLLAQANTSAQVPRSKPQRSQKAPAPKQYAQVASRSPASVAPAGVPDVLLKINVESDTIDTSTTTVFVNNEKLRGNDRSIRVPLDRKVAVRVMHKKTQVYANDFILSSKDLKGADSFRLDVRLKRKGSK